MAEPPRDYHHYVIRDGRLVGEFEAMYRHSDAVPWHQDQQDEWIDVRLTTEMLREFRPFDEIHDCGCGLGYYLRLMRDRLGTTDCVAFGYDISPTACEQAGRLFPGFNFRTLNLSQPPTQPADGTGRSQGCPRRLFIIRGTLWYVFPAIANVVAGLRNLMSAGDLLLVVQKFPPLEAPFVSKEIFPDHHAVIDRFQSNFVPVRHLWYQDTLKTANDNWFIGLFRPRQSE